MLNVGCFAYRHLYLIYTHTQHTLIHLTLYTPAAFALACTRTRTLAINGNTQHDQASRIFTYTFNTWLLHWNWKCPARPFGFGVRRSAFWVLLWLWLIRLCGPPVVCLCVDFGFNRIWIGIGIVIKFIVLLITITIMSMNNTIQNVNVNAQCQYQCQCQWHIHGHIQPHLYAYPYPYTTVIIIHICGAFHPVHRYRTDAAISCRYFPGAKPHVPPSSHSWVQLNAQDLTCSCKVPTCRPSLGQSKTLLKKIEVLTFNSNY
jgi:hypothetical protein